MIPFRTHEENSNIQSLGMNVHANNFDPFETIK